MLWMNEEKKEHPDRNDPCEENSVPSGAWGQSLVAERSNHCQKILVNIYIQKARVKRIGFFKTGGT